MAAFQFLNVHITHMIIGLYLIVSGICLALLIRTRNRMWLHFVAFTGGFFALNYVEALSASIIGPTTQWFTENALTISLVASLNPLFGVLIQPPVAYLSDRIRTPLGQRKPFAILSMILLAASLAATPFAPSLWLLFVFVMFYQLANDVGFAAFFPLLGDLFPEKFRGRAAMMQETASAFGMFVGTTYGGLLYGDCRRRLAAQGLPGAEAGGPYPLSPDFLLNPYSLGALLVVVGYCVVIFLVKEPRREPLPYERFSFVQYFRQLTINRALFKFYWVILLIAIMNTLLSQYWTLYAPDFLGLSVEDATQMYRWRFLVNVLTVPLFAWMSDYIGRRSLLLAGAGLWMLGSIGGALTRNPEHVELFYVYFVLFGLGWSALLGPLMPFLLDMAPKEKFGQYCGAMMIFRGGSRFVVMPLIGLVIEYLPRATVNGLPEMRNWYLIWPLSIVSTALCIWLLATIKPESS